MQALEILRSIETLALSFRDHVTEQSRVITRARHESRRQDAWRVVHARLDVVCAAVFLTCNTAFSFALLVIYW